MLASASNEQLECFLAQRWEGGWAGPMRRRWWLGVFALGIAGFLLIAAIWGTGPKRESGIVPDLVETLGDQRPVEPRLTGGFRYSPCTTATDSERLLPRVVCAGPLQTSKDPEIKRIRRRFESMRGTGDDHADGIGRLVFADGSKSIESLESAISRSPRDARLLNDLAAAYFVRAHQRDQPQDLLFALDFAARACAADPHLPEARFNLALTLDRLQLRESAIVAWDRYQRADPSSGWADEARQRLRVLDRPPVSPQSARARALESLLGEWGRAVIAGDWGSAEASLRKAEEIGKALKKDSGDVSVESAVAAIQKELSSSRQSRQLAEIARGHVAFEEGMLRFRALDIEAAEKSFQQAREALHRGGSPAGLWALCGLARCWAYEGRQREAGEAFTQVARRARSAGFTSLTGWAQWGIGWLRVRQGRLSEGLTHYRWAEQAYRQVEEAESLGAVRHFLGENLSMLGLSAEGWKYRYRALQDLFGLPNSFRRHTLLMEAAATAADEGLPHAGLLLQSEGIKIAEASKDPIIFTETHRARGQLLLKLGRAEEAVKDLEAARHSASLAPDSAPGRKLIADLRWAEGEALRQQNAETALERLTEAVTEFEVLKAPFSQVRGLLARAQTYRSLGRYDEAAQDVNAALLLIEEPGSSIRDQDLKLSYSESIQSVYDEAISLEWIRNRDREAALGLLERARAFPGSVPEADFLKAPADGVAVAYALLADRLLIWVVGEDGISTFERPVGLREMERRVSALLDSIQRRGPEFQTAAADLHELLIPEPLAEVPENQILYFLPDKVLNQVPFAALWNATKRQFLIEDHPIAVASSLSALEDSGDANQPLSGRPSVLIVGNPAFDRRIFNDLSDLPEADRETEKLRALFPDSFLLSRNEATRRRILDQLDRFDVFVFIGHAVVNTSIPSRSYLVLASSVDPPDSGFLLSRDLASHEFHRLRVVVLSACSTVGPRTSRPVGLSGIAEPFLRAGARVVVGTLWTLDDRKSQETLVPFYQSLAQGRSPVMALRDAQLAVIRTAVDGGFGSVADWAVFESVSN